MSFKKNEEKFVKQHQHMIDFNAISTSCPPDSVKENIPVFVDKNESDINSNDMIHTKSN